MAQQTQTRMRRGTAPATGRGRFARGTTTPSRRVTPTPGLRRRKPQQSGLKKAMNAVLPAAAAKKAAPSSKKGKAGGLAIAAAAAAAAFKNRDKLAGMVGKGSSSRSDSIDTDGTVNNAAPPSTTTP